MTHRSLLTAELTRHLALLRVLERVSAGRASSALYRTRGGTAMTKHELIRLLANDPDVQEAVALAQQCREQRLLLDMSRVISSAYRKRLGLDSPEPNEAAPELDPPEDE